MMIDITVQTPKIDIENPNRGEPGRDGIGIHYMGEINEYNDLPLTAEEGDAYYWAGKLYIFKDDEFPAENKGIQYQGPQGPEGPQGPPGKQGIQGQQGIQGEAFAISKVYKSVSEMNADFENAEVKEGQFVLINTGNVEDEDNAKLFVKGGTSYNYLTDLSGAAGITGPQGPEGPQGPPGENVGLSGIATTEEAIAGVVDNKAMTPLKTKEAINAQTQNKADLVDGKVPKDQLPSKVYIKNFTEEDFTKVGSDSVLTISAEEHQAGSSPIIVSLTKTIDGVSYPYYANTGVDNNGNVVINVSEAFTGKIILDGGYLQ